MTDFKAIVGRNVELKLGVSALRRWAAEGSDNAQALVDRHDLVALVREMRVFLTDRPIEGYELQRQSLLDQTEAFKETPEEYMQREGWQYMGSASDDA